MAKNRTVNGSLSPEATNPEPEGSPQLTPTSAIVRAHIRGVSPYSQSRRRNIPKLAATEKDDAYEERTWWDRCHRLESGQLFIPPMSLKNALDSAVAFRADRIPGGGMKTWKQEFEVGVMCIDAAPLFTCEGEEIFLKTAIGPEKFLAVSATKGVEPERLYLNADGRRGGGKRVERIYPRITPGWVADVEFHVLNLKITRKEFEKYLTVAGKFIGIGRFRPQNRGFYGRFVVESLEWVPVYE